MNIGILYPRSDAHPDMSMQFINGFKACLRFHEASHMIHMSAENAGFGGVDKDVMAKIEQLILMADSDMLVLYLDEKMFATVKPTLEAYGKLVLIVNPGADYPATWQPSANIVHLTLNQAFLCWLTGKIAGMRPPAEAAMATSFYDCGYLHSAMMVSGFAQQGGEVMYNYVNNHPYDNRFHIDELKAYLATNSSTRKLLCIYDQQPARMLYAALANESYASDLQLFASPMMLEPDALSGIGNGFPFALQGYIPWSGNNDNEAADAFYSYTNNKPDKSAGLFALLGWEAAAIVQKAVAASLHPQNGAALVTGLLDMPIDSPRGQLTLDRHTQRYCAPFLLRKLLPHALYPFDEKAAWPAQVWKEYLSSPPQGVVSGWTNTYLCY